MKIFWEALAVAIATVCLYSSCCGSEFDEELDDEEDQDDQDDKWSTIGISIIVKNKAHSLPFSLTCLEQLDYPKKRLYVWFFIDGHADDSLAIIQTWMRKYKHKYNNVYVDTDNKPKEPMTIIDESYEWSEERKKRKIRLRQKALFFAKKQWADYVFMLDATVFLTDPSTLKNLIRKKLPIVAPMLLSDGLYSNFWDAVSENYFFEKTDRYDTIIGREATGCFIVPVVHTAVLIDLRPKKSDLLTYNPAHLKSYKGPVDDILPFAFSASKNGMSMTVCNDRLYGFVPIPLENNHVSMKSNESEQLLNVKMEALSRGVVLPIDEDLIHFVSYPLKDRLGLDKVFMINLERRAERRHLMELSFQELGIEATIVEAIDGLELNYKDLAKIGVTLLPNYEDPHQKRPMKAGEIGCFLSHYKVWKEIAKRHIQRSLVLEDDVRFTPFFRRRFEDLLRELESIEWELVYIGRKILVDGEDFVSVFLTRPRYSYWTLGYLLSEAGARKLIQAEPLAKMLPVDEFLPIMFNAHPNDTWKSYFPRRDLKAYSASPLLIHPTHYTGEPGYVSDTEDSHVLTANTTVDGELAKAAKLLHYEL